MFSGHFYYSKSICNTNILFRMADSMKCLSADMLQRGEENKNNTDTFIR